MGNSKDLVCVFDIESGVWAGPMKGIQLPLRDIISDKVNDLLRLYDEEYIIKEKVKITLPRYVSVGLLPFETFQRGCYQDPELAFLYKMDRYTFLLGEDGVDQFLDFWADLLKHTRDEGSILLMAHNASYDIQGILHACLCQTGNRLIDLTRSFLEACEGSYLAFPESVHDDKTFDLHLGKHHLRLIDTLNLSPGSCRSLKQYGVRASAMYGKDYQKGDQYDYDYKIRKASDLPPTEEETRYTDRDLQLCLFAGMMAIYPYRQQLAGKGQKYGATDFPFSATQRDKAVNDGLAIQMEHPDCKPSTWKKIYRKRILDLKEWCFKWGNVPDVETYQMLQKAATGGIITCNESYVNKPVEDVGSMDLSSSYPACAGDFWYPRIELKRPYTGPMTEEFFRAYLKAVLIPMAEELRSGHMVLDSMAVNHKWCIGMRTGFVCKVRFHDILYHDFGEDVNGLHYWLPVLPYKDFEEDANRESYKTMRSKVVDNKTLEYYCTHIGLLIILAFYDYSSIDFLDGYTYEMAIIQPVLHSRFRAGLIGKQNAKKIRKAWESGQMSDEEMIEATGMAYLKGQDRDTMAAELKAYYDASKVPLNAMYGASYRQLLRKQRDIDQLGGYHLIDGTYDPHVSVAYPTGEYIAIYGQLKLAHAMLWAMSKKLPILYAHTDSLKIQGLTPELVGEYNKLIETPPDERDGEPVSFRSYGIGLMDYEGSHDLGIVVGNMRIITWDRDSGYHITMSGLNEYKAFPRKQINGMDFFEFVSHYLRDGRRYAVDADAASGKTRTDYSYAGVYVPGVGYSMQSIVDAEFILNNPESIRQGNIEVMYNEVVGDYHSADWYAKQKYVIRKGTHHGENESTGE